MEEKTNKHEARKILISYAIKFFTENYKKYITIVTLPSSLWIFEKSLVTKLRKELKDIYNKFVCFEKDPDFYEMRASNMPRSDRDFIKRHNKILNCNVLSNGRNFVLYNIDVFDYINKNISLDISQEYKYDFIFLNFKSLSADFKHNLPFIKEVLHDKALLCICFVKGRVESNFEEELGNGFKLSHRFDYDEGLYQMSQLIYEYEKINVC